MKKILGGIAAIVLVVFAVIELMPTTREAAGVPAPRELPPPQVSIVVAQKESIHHEKKYIAKVESISQVELQAQVNGYIEKIHFTEGGLVKQGDILFTIDQAQYKAMVEQRKAELAGSQASLSRAKKYLAMLKAADNRSVSQSNMDKAESDVLETQAQVNRAAAALKLANIDLARTRIKAPISGRIGRALVTKGNYVSPGSSILTRIIQWDPIRVVFSMPDSAYLAMANEKKSKLNPDTKLSSDIGSNPKELEEKIQARVRLSDGTLLSQLGIHDFADNQMNANTGTMAMRLRFSNKDEHLIPNAYVNVIFQNQAKDKKVLLPQASILMDREGAFVWALDRENKVVRTPVTPGETLGVNRIIESGLETGLQIIVSGTQKVQPGMKVIASPVELTLEKRG